MVLTDDDRMAQRLQDRRTLCFGKRERFAHEDRGWNFRMTNLQAAIGCAQFEQIERHLSRKRELAGRYSEALRGLPIQLPHTEPWAKSSVWMYAVLLRDEVHFSADEFARRLLVEGVQTRPFFKGMHEQPAYRRLGLFAGLSLPVTERSYRRGLYLPSGQAITDEQIAVVTGAVRRVLT